MVMALIARIIGLSSLAGALSAGLGFAVFQQYGDASIPCLALACFGGLVGAVAGAAREVVVAVRQRPSR
jgi:hypothetical protein